MESEKHNGNDAMVQIAVTQEANLIVPPSIFTSSSSSNTSTNYIPATESHEATNANKAPASTSAKNSRSASEEVEDEEEEEDNDIIGKMKTILLMLELSAFVSIMVLLIASLTLNRLQNFVMWDLELWKWCVLASVILSGRLVSQWVINIYVLLIEKKLLLKQKVLYFVYGLRKSVGFFIWLTLVLLAWILLFDNGVKRTKGASKILHRITRTLASCLAGAALWIVKTFTVKLIAVSFQSKLFFDRIQESIFHQYVLRALSTQQNKKGEQFRILNSAMQFIFRTRKEKHRKCNFDAEKIKKMIKEKISAWNLKSVISFISGSKLSTMSNWLDKWKDYEEIESESDPEKLADRIFNNVADDPQCECIGKEQLRPLLPKKGHVKKLLKQFEGAATSGNINKSDFKEWVIKVYMERESLKCALRDAKTAIEELNRIFSGIVIVVMIIVWLLVMGFLTSKIILLIASQLVLLAFMFGNAAKTCFEAIIFVFVMHPFDVGDRCLVDGVQLVVDEMNILTTIFLKYDKEKIYYPNSVLATKPISNFCRSPKEMGDSVEFSIDVFTSVEIIGKLKSRIQDYLEGNEKHWRPQHSVVVKEIVDVNKLKMALFVNHTINFQDYLEKLNRRSALVLELKHIFEDLGIKYKLLPQEVCISYTRS